MFRQCTQMNYCIRKHILVDGYKKSISRNFIHKRSKGQRSTLLTERVPICNLHQIEKKNKGCLPLSLSLIHI